MNETAQKIISILVKDYGNLNSIHNFTRNDFNNLEKSIFYQLIFSISIAHPYTGDFLGAQMEARRALRIDDLDLLPFHFDNIEDLKNTVINLFEHYGIIDDAISFVNKYWDKKDAVNNYLLVYVIKNEVLIKV